MRATFSRWAVAASVLLPSAAAATGFSQLYAFSTADGVGDANNPYAGLIIDANGNLYGTSYGGGTEGLGTVYEVSPPTAGGTAWTETVLYSFYANRSDGVHPTGRLAFGPNGALYGTTSASGGAASNGAGTVFQLSPPSAPGGAWTETTLHVFGAKDDGATPYAGVVVGANGTLYGTTSAGGVAYGNKGGAGTVYSLAPPASSGAAWTEAILHSFLTDTPDGQNPASELLLGPGGVLFGTAPNCGGKLNCSGVAFELAPPPGGTGAWTERLILQLPASGAAGAGPSRGLISDGSGDLYGVTSLGVGTAFRLTPPGGTGGKWSLTELARFGYDKAGGPQGEVLFGPGGVLFGTLTYGSKGAGGTAFELTPPASGGGLWPQTVLYGFPSKPPGGGVFPVGNLVADAHGNLYGVTEIGGADG